MFDETPAQIRARYLNRKAAGECVIGRCGLPASDVGVTCFGHYLTQQGGLARELRVLERERNEREENATC